MAQIRKLQEGGQSISSLTTKSPQKPPMLVVGNTEYDMDKYIQDLEKNFEGWLESENFNDNQKNEQRRLFPIFIQKLRSGVITLTEGGGWRDASLESYNDKNPEKDKWGHLAGFATEGRINQTPYKEESQIKTREAKEYDPTTGLAPLYQLLFGKSKKAFISLDNWTDDSHTKRGLANRSEQVRKGLLAFKANPEKYFKFKYQEDKDDLMGKIDYVLDAVLKDDVINQNELFYLSNLGFDDVTDLFTTDFSQNPSQTKKSGKTGGEDKEGKEGNYGDGSYGNTASAESIASWLNTKPTYKVKKTPGIQDFNLNTLYTMHPNILNRLRSTINSIQDQKALSISIYHYFYNRKPGGQRFDYFLELIPSGRLQAEANKYPNQAVRVALEEMVANNSDHLEDIGSNKYILSDTLTKNNTILMWDNKNKRLSEVSAYYSPNFRNSVIQKFAEETGVYDIPSNLNWYSQFYKQGGVIKAKTGTNFWGIKNNYYNFTKDVTGNDDQMLFLDPQLNMWIPMPANKIEKNTPIITKKLLDDTFNWNNFNNFKTQALLQGKNYFTFNTNTGKFEALDSNVNQEGKLLPNVWNLNDIVNPSPEKGSVGWRIDKSKEDFTFDNAFVGDDPYNGDFNDQTAFNKWVTETNMLNSGWKGIYYSKADNKWYRTKNTPTTGNLLTASTVDITKSNKRKDPLETLRQGPLNFDKFMQFFGPASIDIGAGIFTTQRNNRGAKRIIDAMHPNYKSNQLEVADPLRYNYSTVTAGHQRGINIESTASNNADNYTDPNLAVAVKRQGTLDRAANDAQVDATANQELQTQIQQRTTTQNQKNKIFAENADDNRAEDNRVELAKVTASIENDKTNTEVWNKIMAKYANQIGDYFTSNMVKKQEDADTANRLFAQSWLDDAMTSRKQEWMNRPENNGKSESDWLLSPEYKRLRIEFNKMLTLGNAYAPYEGLNSKRWPYVYRKGGVLSLKTQALLNKVIK